MQVDLVGYLTWNGKERRSNRYGGVGLQERKANVNEGETSPDIDLSAAAPLIGKRIRLTALVLESNKSCHDGDFFRRIYPSKTEVGTELDLGTGQLVDIEGDRQFGFPQLIFRRDGAEHSDWMDPNLLYKLHDHKVKLSLVESA